MINMKNDLTNTINITANREKYYKENEHAVTMEGRKGAMK